MMKGTSFPLFKTMEKPSDTENAHGFAMRYIEMSPSYIKRNSFLPSSILMEERLDLSMLDQEASQRI